MQASVKEKVEEVSGDATGGEHGAAGHAEGEHEEHAHDTTKLTSSYSCFFACLLVSCSNSLPPGPVFLTHH